MPAPTTLLLDSNGDPVTRIRYECTEATAGQAAGPDGGRVSSSQSVTIIATGHPTERVSVAGVNPAHAVVQGSLDGTTWTDLAAGLPLAATAGDEVEVLVRLIVKRWGSLLNPHIDTTLFLGSVEPAAITEA